VFERMHAATRRSALVERASRQARLDALAALVHDNAERFVTAISADFGHRSAHETRLLELFPSPRVDSPYPLPLRRLDEAAAQAGIDLVSGPDGRASSRSRWRRRIIVPWNYPLYLAVSPLAAALAAGNRVMIKMSEFTPPHRAKLLAELVAK